jgi:hypothetical protein
MNFIVSVVKEILAPLLPVLQSQGGSIDMGKLIEKLSELGDQPDLSEIVTTAQPVQPGGQGGQSNAPTERNYNRTSTSEQTQQGGDKNRIAMLLSGKSTGGRNGQSNGQANGQAF